MAPNASSPVSRPTPSVNESKAGSKVGAKVASRISMFERLHIQPQNSKGKNSAERNASASPEAILRHNETESERYFSGLLSKEDRSLFDVAEYESTAASPNAIAPRRNATTSKAQSLLGIAFPRVPVTSPKTVHWNPVSLPPENEKKAPREDTPVLFSSISTFSPFGQEEHHKVAPMASSVQDPATTPPAAMDNQPPLPVAENRDTQISEASTRQIHCGNHDVWKQKIYRHGEEPRWWTKGSEEANPTLAGCGAVWNPSKANDVDWINDILDHFEAMLTSRKHEPRQFPGGSQDAEERDLDSAPVLDGDLIRDIADDYPNKIFL